MLALLHAVFAWQAQLGGRCEEAALEAVQGELAGLFRKERLLVVRVPPLVPGQAGGPAQRLEAVVIAAGHKAGHWRCRPEGRESQAALAGAVGAPW